MSNSPEQDLDLELHFLPAWAKQPSQQNRYADYKGEAGGADRRRDWQDRPQRRTKEGPRFGGAPRGDRSGPSRRDDFRRGRDRGRPQERIEAPLLELQVAFKPDEHGVDSLAKQIRMTGRAYPLFDIAQMILQKPERHSVILSVKKRVEGTTVQPLFVCAIDDSLWLSEEEAARYVLEKFFSTFYQPERTKIDPPKGTYTFVAQCGLSGVILGPPNYHDYQNQLRKLHSERFSRMPFEMFKARVKIVRDETVVKQWIEEQSYRTEYVCLNMPEAQKLGSREEVHKHFREHHQANIIRPVESVDLAGVASREVKNAQLSRLIRARWEEQRRFPLQIATVLSQQFATRGLQFFKVNKTVTHVAVARPHYLDVEETPVSETVRRIVDFVNAHPKCTHKQLLAALAPRPLAAPPAASPAPVAEGMEATSPKEAAPAPADLTPEMAAILTDLHWLVHQGHVIEFANGILETAKKPISKPKLAAPEPAGQPPAETAATREGTQSVEPFHPGEDLLQTDVPLPMAEARGEGATEQPGSVAETESNEKTNPPAVPEISQS